MPRTKISLCIEQDAEVCGCCWTEVEKVVRHWATIHGSSLPAWCFPQQGGREWTFDLQTDELLTAIRQLHNDLYDLQVSFTVSFHS
ncbi:MAG: hypothetical protein KKC76_01235 [Proteobacteria bacterium]|nr:hypothetical protein [Pseudomonadota bacterium]MBU4295839.1 hypothetical protein [Pseudomonadota bacterium]MCG2747863.1 hypothetical protein [Desulfobulbaceae bacterium]